MLNNKLIARLRDQIKRTMSLYLWMQDIINSSLLLHRNQILPDSIVFPLDISLFIV